MATTIKQFSDQEQQKRVNEIVATVAELKERIGGLEKEVAELQTELLTVMDVGEKYFAGDFTVSVVQSQRFDAKALAEDLPVEKFEDLYTLTLDMAKVKKRYSEDDLEDFITYTKPSLRISKAK